MHCDAIVAALMILWLPSWQPSWYLEHSIGVYNVYMSREEPVLVWKTIVEQGILVVLQDALFFFLSWKCTHWSLTSYIDEGKLNRYTRLSINGFGLMICYSSGAFY